MEAGVLNAGVEACPEMLTSVNCATQKNECYNNALITGTTSSSEANTFEQQLLNVISESLERSTEDAGESQAATRQMTSPNETTGSAKSQILVSYARTSDVQTSASESGASDAATQNSASVSSTASATTATTEDMADSSEPAVMTALRAALQAAGHDPDEFDLTYQEQYVGYLDGSYLDRTITATFSDGYKESYGADLTAASPNGTVLSIEHTLRDIAAGDYS